tara:strand:+ start:662 stop:1318 length:657 start_codon:yes stop_codon:yes gene_type:complete
MFELYDIFDNNEINVILLVIVVIILIIVIVGLGIYDYTMKSKLIKVETKLKSISDKLDININNNNLLSDIPKNNNNNNNNSNSYKEKYEDLLKEKDAKQSQSMQYSPSEYSTLLKYNPILPYSAFTMDIINNAYLDMNEQGMYEDKYFALSNYDNIYDSTRGKNNSNSNSNSNSNVNLADQQAVDMGKLAEMQDADNPSLNSVVSDIGPETTSQDSKF